MSSIFSFYVYRRAVCVCGGGMYVCVCVCVPRDMHMEIRTGCWYCLLLSLPIRIGSLSKS